MPTPVAGGKLEQLRGLLNIRDEEWRLVVGFMVASMRPLGPYPILEVTGEQGSAKSTTCEFILRILDETEVGRRSAPTNEREMAISLKHSRVALFDNMSHLSKEMSDVLCRVSTGGAFSTRRLYTDDEELVFNVQRPIILNGIAGIARHADLLERTFAVELQRIPSGKRRLEVDLRADFDAARAAVLGALLDAVVCALKNFGSTRSNDWPRLADPCRWVTAAEPALGWTPGTFLTCMKRSEVSAARRALEDDEALVKALQSTAMAAGGAGWSGTATQLLDKLPLVAGMPGAANVLSAKLRRLAPPLRNIGIEVNFFRVGHESVRFISLRWSQEIIARIDGIDGDSSEQPAPAGATFFGTREGDDHD